MVKSELLIFYGWWQVSVCTFAFLALMGIWWHIGRKQKDTGQVWLAISVLCWSFSGVVELFYAPYMNDAALADEYLYQLNGWRSIFSLFNSLFILLALPWFRYIPKLIEPLIKSRFWLLIVGLPFVFSLLPTLSRLFLGASITLISELDVYYATLTLVFLGYVLWDSFANRRLPILAVLSLVCILFTFWAQLQKLNPLDTSLILYSSIFKTSLIMLFFALALSWVKELSENVIPPSIALSLRLDRIKSHEGKFEHRAEIDGIPGKDHKTIKLSPAVFNLLLKFAERRKNEEEGWLEIRPKNEQRAQKQYDIKDYNELKRLHKAMLDGLFGEGNWTKNLHELPFKDAFFEWSEKRERKVRLALLPNQIVLGEELKGL